MRVLKWRVPIDDGIHAIGGGTVVHVASQYGLAEEVQVWTLEAWPEIGDSKQLVRAFGTGHDVPDGWEPIGSVVVLAGELVWHVFRKK